MNQPKFNIKDESQERKYFSIVPNFIVNHSTLEERGFYLTLKRIAGEHSTVRYSARDLAKMCGISDDTVYRLLQSLIRRGWIKEAGKIPTGHKPRQTYAIVNLWKKNIDFYDKEENRTDAVNKDKVAPGRDIKPQTKDTEEEPIKEELSNTSETLPDGKSRQVGANKKENSRCPLLLKEKYPSLADKYPGGHSECVEFIAAVEEEKGHKFINLPKQFGIVHRILRAGFDFNDMNRALDAIQKNNFYQDKGWDFATVAQWLERK
ncbi:MAG: helix-turn-helix domain-containing protein [Patescibacteria group bacterium]|nr:helix-turn-helix domain-containing protein [Patescibacteria group bacterium]